MKVPLLHRERITDVPRNPIRILQFGGGNFLRAFLGWMVEVLNEKADFAGDIVLIKPTAGGNYQELMAQDGLYHVWLRGCEDGEPHSELKRIHSVRRIINPYEDWQTYLETARWPGIRYVVSNTTESGIAYQPTPFPDKAVPTSFPAKLAIWLYERFRHFSGDKARGCVILPCELIEGNGNMLKEHILHYADDWELEEAFKNWLKEENYFCNTLVDRIVSGYPEEDARTLREQIGMEDRMLVAAETYHSWVIEGPRFLYSCPPEGLAGLNIKFVEDLRPYREMKVRILNGLHTLMVPVGYLLGHRHVHECMEDPVLGAYLQQLAKEEICSVLSLPSREIDAFRDAVWNRFRNPFLRHELMAIALNSIDKFKARVLPTLLDYCKKYNRLPDRILLAFAALIVLYKGQLGKHNIPLNDSKKYLDFFKEAWGNTDGSASGIRQACALILGNKDMWGRDLTEIPGLSDRMSEMLISMEKQGVASTLQTKMQ